MASERVQRQIDRLLDQAEEVMGRLNWDSVRDCAQAVLGLDSENADALPIAQTADQPTSFATPTPSSGYVKPKTLRHSWTTWDMPVP